MTARHSQRGRDRWANPGNQTAWKRERACGPLLPMAEARKPGLLARIFGR